MPQLPGGRHVAINAQPLRDLLAAAEAPGNVHKVMAIAGPLDVERYIDVYFLVPEAEAGPSANREPLREGSLPAPAGMVPVPSGLTLGEWDALTECWSDADKAALREFIEGRAAPLIRDCVEAARSKQDELRRSGEFLPRVLSAWHDAGIHPAHEDPEGFADPGSPEWDDYEILAALGALVRTLSDPAHAEVDWRILAKLSAFWSLAAGRFPELRDWPPPGTPLREAASVARAAGRLERLEPGDRGWLHAQAIAECVGAWNMLGDTFLTIAPESYRIVELVVVSPQANRYFDGRR